MHEEAITTIIEPEAIAFSFDAIGWKVLLLLVLAALIMTLIWMTIRYRKDKYRREALALLAAISNNHSTSLQKKAVQVHTLLKQICLTKYSRQEVASLEGDKWASYLNSRIKKPCYSVQDIKCIQLGLFKANSLDAQTVERYINQSKTWIKKHVV
ncbi:DUF4381 domain-containing protein [Carboxylicivirga taeanensis]|uniref:DUF4381 domain-containing protein n=1 Tax=Carboxylicivirga taeanensis TaxID=1416875 RepID=UPI003F6DB8BB